VAEEVKDEIFPEDPIHNWFGLTYSKWLTIPRVIMEGMPIEWQKKMVQLLDELDNTFDYRPEEGNYWVTLREKGKFKSLPKDLCNYRYPDIEHRKKTTRT